MKRMLLLICFLVFLALGCSDSSPAPCGNGVLDPGELCDPAISAGQPGACPTSCDDGRADTLDALLGEAEDCRAVCAHVALPPCGQQDGICPPCCDSVRDQDCQPQCGNGVVEADELCDGNCPSVCTDGNACTVDELVGTLGGCYVTCRFTPIAECRSGDGCCPAECDSLDDSDCGPRCGNSVLEAGETCDPPASCPANCDDADPCTEDHFLGNAANCTASCEHAPVGACRGGDGCCPVGCDVSNDADCVNLCGNGQLDQGEACDPAIPAGEAGACPASCQDTDPCTTDTLAGEAANCTARCQFTPITSCTGGDGCCPHGCNFGSDSDCPGGSLGDACQEDGDCLQGLCLDESDGAPGGYCSQYCTQDGDCGAGNSCVGVSGLQPGTCRLGCQENGDCRAPDYVCRDIDDDGDSECWTPGVTGAACDEAADCERGICFEDGAGWPRGYCSEGCSLIACDHGTCAQIMDGWFCLASCEQTACRVGYQCSDLPGGGEKVCLPTHPECASDDDCGVTAPVCDLTADPPRCVGCSDNDDCTRFGPPRHICNPTSGICEPLRANGEPCTQDLECAGGICLEYWLDGGYCTEDCFQSPDKLPDCSLGGGHCVTSSLMGPMCMTTCEPGGPPICRSGYQCVDMDGDGLGECMMGTYAEP